LRRLLSGPKETAGVGCPCATGFLLLLCDFDIAGSCGSG
jgi:hypothetical protein